MIFFAYSLIWIKKKCDFLAMCSSVKQCVKYLFILLQHRTMQQELYTPTNDCSSSYNHAHYYNDNHAYHYHDNHAYHYNDNYDEKTTLV